MQARHLATMAGCALVLGVTWYTLSKSSSVPETPPTFAPPLLTSTDSIHLQSHEAPPPAAYQPEPVLTTRVESEAYHEETPTKIPSPEISELLEQISSELHIEEGLTPFNLMLLKDLALRLNESKVQGPNVLNELKTDWPVQFNDTLKRISLALEAEATLQKDWQGKLSQNPQGYREALLNQQQNILGNTLFQKIYAEDLMDVDDAGLSASFSSANESPELVSEAHQNKLKLLQQWQQNQISETELSNALSQSLTTNEINQLMETSTHEAAWLERINAFLEEYRYIEQSGIVGEDERLLREELIEKHFQPENRQIVNQFLFSTRPSSS